MKKIKCFKCGANWMSNHVCDSEILPEEIKEQEEKDLEIEEKQEEKDLECEACGNEIESVGGRYCDSCEEDMKN